MFGGGFVGEDVNADAIGFAGGFGGGQGTGGGTPDGVVQGMPGGGFDTSGMGTYTPSVDPAEAAARSASAGLTKDDGHQLGKLTEQSGGILGSIYNLAGNRPRILRRRQRVYERNSAAYRLDQAKRSLAQYQADSKIEEQKLAQSYAGRGLGESSIQQEGMQYYRDTRDRTMQSLSQQVALAQDYQNLVRSQISNSYASPWLSLLGSLTGMGGALL